MQVDYGLLLAAPFIGSFLGVVVRRWPRGTPMVLARSKCESCGAALGVRDLLPLVSFAAARGRCRHCGEPVPWFHPAIELAAMAVALSAMVSFSGPALWPWCVLGWGLLALAWIDAEWMLLPDVLTLPLLATGLGMGVLVAPDSLVPRAAGAVAGWGVFAGIAWIYRRLRHRDGLGGGDAKLLAVAGAWLGLEMLPRVVMLAALAAAAWAMTLQLWRGRMAAAEPVPFGPWLALSIWLVALTG
jgi:leader peptidase (prepilin peptidase)/N-methyltransferase